MLRYITNLIIPVLLLSSCGQQTEEVKPVRKELTETVYASGILEASDTYTLKAQSEGFLTELDFRENDLVRKGQLLAVIDNKQSQLNTRNASELYEIARANTISNAPALAAARNSITSAREKMELDSIQEMRYRRLWEANSIARSDYDRVLLQYKNARTSYANAIEYLNELQQEARRTLIINQGQKDVNHVSLSFNEVRALFDGRVYYRHKQRGDHVMKGDPIATIGNPNLIYAKISVDEGSIAKIKIGQEAVVRLNVDNDRTYRAKVTEILPAFNETSQSFACKLQLSDSLAFRVINTQLQANIITGSRPNALVIPRRFLNYGNTVTIKGQNEPVPVKTGIAGSDWVEILGGIDDNTVLVTGKSR